MATKAVGVFDTDIIPETVGRFHVGTSSKGWLGGYFWSLTIQDAPILSTDAVNKAYVDAQVVSAAGVASFNALTGVVVLAAGTNITLTPVGNTITIDSAGGSGTGTVTHTAGNLTANRLVLGNAVADITVLGSLGTTTTLLHGNAAGAPTYAGVAIADLTATGTPGATTFLRGDNTWAVPAGTVSTSGSPATGAITLFSGATSITSGDLSGDVVTGGTLATTISTAAVTNAKLAAVATATFKGRIATGTGVPQDLTGTQATTLLNLFTSTLQGLVPGSGGDPLNFLRADGTWAAPTGSGNTTSTALNVNRLTKADGPNSVIDSKLTDDGTQLSYTGSAMKITPITTTARNALTPSLGMFIVNSTTGTIDMYDGTAWRVLVVT